MSVWMRQKDMAQGQEQEEARRGQEESAENILPVRGMILDPMDRQLVIWYLIKKNLGKPHPLTPAVPCMEANEFYSKSPTDLVGGGPFGETDRQWCFLVRGVERSRVRVVGNIDVGFWRSLGVEESIYDYDSSGENIIGLKIQFTYYSGAPPCAKKTHWRMDEYIMPHSYAKIAPWAVARVKRGRDFRRDIPELFLKEEEEEDI